MSPLGAGALLKMLGSGVELVRQIGGANRPEPIEGADFADLLDRVSKGSLRPGEAVSIDPTLELELTGDQLRRLTEAADRLEAAGASKGVVLLDDLALEVDVLTRTVTRRVDLSDGTAVAGVDAVVRAPAAETTRPAGPPGGALSNASLLETLARDGRDAA